MTPTLRGRLAGVAAAILLLGSIGSPVAQAETVISTPRQAGAVSPSPFKVVGSPAGQLYATGPNTARRTLLARSAAHASSRPISAAAGGAGGSAAGGVRPLAAPGPVQAGQTTAPDNHLAGFGGLAETDQASPAVEPANSTVAVGPDQVVQVANLALRITNRDGTAATNMAVPTFFALPLPQPPEGIYFDRQPRVIYDSLHGRFVATELSWDCITGDLGDTARFGHGYVDLAVSRTTDPNGIWDLYVWAYVDLVPEDPSLGTSTDKLAISSNLSAMTQGEGGPGDGACAESALTPYAGDILVSSWADALARKTHTLPTTELAAGPPVAVFGVRAALQAPAVSSTLFVVGRQQVIDSKLGRLPDDVVVTTFVGLPTKGPGVSVGGDWDMTAAGSVGPFVDPPAPHQPGSPATIVNAVDGSAQDALWQAGKLTWATTYPCTPSGDASARDCVRVTQLDTSLATVVTPPTETQDFVLARKNFDSYEPGIGISGDGTLDVVYSQSNSTAPNYPSSYQQYHRSTDAANTLSAPVQLAAGTGAYPGTQWGTYVGLGQDPQISNAVWQANAFSLGAGYWSTFVDQLGRPAGTTYVPITPVRIVDSRDGPRGLSGLAGKFVSSTARTFQVTGLGASPPIPAKAVAVTGNVTVARQAAAGYVAVTPTAQNNPSSSTLNFPLGDNRANNVTVPLSGTGTLSMTYVASAGKTTDLIFDVTGYFLPDNSAATYHPVAPTRLLNSVSGIGQPGGAPAKFTAGVPQTFTIGDGVTIPLAASAITGNLTVTRQTRPGYLAITPDFDPAPSASTLNFPLVDDRANGFTAPLHAHQLSIVYIAGAAATTDVILDVTGYYEPDLTGLRFYPLNPGRILDSRPGVASSGLTGPFSSSIPRNLVTTSHWGVPGGALAVTGNLTVVSQTARGYVSITPDPDPNPATSTLNFPLGDTRANGVTVPLNLSGWMALVYKGTSGAARTQLIFDVSGYFQ
jgi:hypothetical protein